MTTKQCALFQQYYHATAFRLEDVYSSFSSAKARAYDYCINDMLKLNGYEHRIPSANAFQFSFAFLYDQDGKTRLRYHTANNVYDFEVN